MKEREQIIEILHKYMKWEEYADEILALPLYSKEFVEWVGKQEREMICRNSTDELYEYWKNLPENKDK